TVARFGFCAFAYLLVDDHPVLAAHRHDRAAIGKAVDGAAHRHTGARAEDFLHVKGNLYSRRRAVFILDQLNAKSFCHVSHPPLWRSDARADRVSEAYPTATTSVCPDCHRRLRSTPESASHIIRHARRL